MQSVSIGQVTLSVFAGLLAALDILGRITAGTCCELLHPRIPGQLVNGGAASLQHWRGAPGPRSCLRPPCIPLGLQGGSVVCSTEMILKCFLSNWQLSARCADVYQNAMPAPLLACSCLDRHIAAGQSCARPVMTWGLTESRDSGSCCCSKGWSRLYEMLVQGSKPTILDSALRQNAKVARAFSKTYYCERPCDKSILQQAVNM